MGKRQFDSNVLDFATAQMQREMSTASKYGPNVGDIIRNPLVRLPKGDYFKVCNNGKSAEVMDSDLRTIQSYPKLDPVTYDLALANALLERKILHLRLKYESDTVDWNNAPSHGVSLSIPEPEPAMLGAIKNIADVLNQKLILEKQNVKVKVTQFRQEIVLSSNMSPMALSFNLTDSVAGNDLHCTAVQRKNYLKESNVTALIEFKNVFKNNEERLHFLRVFFKQRSVMDCMQLINKVRETVTVTRKFSLAHNQK